MVRYTLYFIPQGLAHKLSFASLDAFFGGLQKLVGELARRLLCCYTDVLLCSADVLLLIYCYTDVLLCSADVLLYC